jgi:23S rRNA (adenine2503-C2)-methyltransferase
MPTPRRAAATASDVPEPDVTEALRADLDLKGLLPVELRQLAVRMGEPAYRGDQLFSWIHGHAEVRLSAMSNLPRQLRERLGQAGAHVSRLELLARQDSETKMASKFLFDADGSQLETVLILDGDRRTVCLSSQVGCPLDCRFCATGQMGFQRNLTVSQIVDQLLQVHAVAVAEDLGRITNIVMMGMGEPLLNYDAVTTALRLIRHAEGPSVGGRRITVSTAGHLPGIRRLADDDLNVGLAISLNATTDEVREHLMPINRKWPIAELIGGARYYFERQGRRVTFEYVLMAGVTDADEDATRLARLTADVACKINLIPYNELGSPHPGADVFRRPDRDRIEAFTRRVRASTKHTVTLRESRGRDIDAACGQLYRRLEADLHPTA